MSGGTADPMIGEVIHGYRLYRGLSGSEDKGGFGDVYFARHSSGAEAVVKLLKPQWTTQREIVSRFLKEAEAAARIRHPGIVAVHNVGFHAVAGHGDRAYLLMERLFGEDLETRIKRERLPLDRVLVFLRQTAGAVGAAHAEKIVHRDLKPANLFIVADPDVVGGERIKVLDFGIAKLSDQQSTMQTRGVFGTPAYMSPEQCQHSGQIDHRSDLYALGCIAYELVAGRPPFGHGGLELVAAHLRDVPASPRVAAPWLPAPVEALIMQLLAKAPEDRLQSCAALVAAIDGISTQLSSVVVPPAPVATVDPRAPTTLGLAAGAVSAAPPRRGRSGLALAIAAGVAVAGGAAVVLLGGGDDAPSIAAKAPSTRPPIAASAPAPLAIDAAVAIAEVPVDASVAEAAVKPPSRSPPKPIPPKTPPKIKPTPGPLCDEVECALTNYAGACCARFRKPEPAPGTPTTELGRDDIRSAMARIRGRAVACGQLSPDFDGVVRVKVVVAPDGSVSSVTAIGGDAAVTPCVEAAVRAAAFPATGRGGTFNYPFKL